MLSPALRSDAVRNLGKILTAARAAFDESGVDIGVESIAHQAGVGVATLYRRFPTKEALVDAVVDEILRSVLDEAESALSNETPAVGLAVFLRALGRLQFEHVGCLNRLLTGGHIELRDEIEAVVRKLLLQAQSAESVRNDLVYEDVVVIIWSLRGVIEATAAVSADAWHRHLDLLLLALRPSDESLTHPPLTPTQVEQAKAAAAHRTCPPSGARHTRKSAPPR